MAGRPPWQLRPLRGGGWLVVIAAALSRPVSPQAWKLCVWWWWWWRQWQCFGVLGSLWGCHPGPAPPQGVPGGSSGTCGGGRRREEMDAMPPGCPRGPSALCGVARVGSLSRAGTSEMLPTGKLRQCFTVCVRNIPLPSSEMLHESHKRRLFCSRLFLRRRGAMPW